MQNASERLIKQDTSNPVSRSNSPEVYTGVVWILTDKMSEFRKKSKAITEGVFPVLHVYIEVNREKNQYFCQQTGYVPHLSTTQQ